MERRPHARELIEEIVAEDAALRESIASILNYYYPQSNHDWDDSDSPEDPSETSFDVVKRRRLYAYPSSSN